MSFHATDKAAAVTEYLVLGEPVTYTDSDSVETPMQAIISRDVVDFPGDYESNVTERRIEIGLLTQFAPAVKQGDLVNDGSITYVLQDLVDDDGVEVTYTAKKQ